MSLSDNRYCKKYMVQALVSEMEEDAQHVPFKKQKTNFHTICIRKSLIN
jgi:hypothetical protein